MTRLHWPAIIEQAAGIVHEYNTPVTLRQLFYRLVAAQVLPNTDTSYKTLSARTAVARRDGGFPELADRGRTIVAPETWTSPQAAIRDLARQYRRDRTEGQAVSIYLGVEKAGMVAQLSSWFGDLGVPIFALGGYSSQTFVDVVRRDTDRFDRPAVLLYAGDFDPSGEDIDRDFGVRADCFHKTIRVALNADQIDAYRLPENPGKTTDARARRFAARHGRLVQVEVDALAPGDLRDLYQSAIDEFWDTSAYEAVLELEADERAELEDLI